MKLSEKHRGNNDPFEGDRTVHLRSLPADARVIKAHLTLTPVAAPDGSKFTEVVNFTASEGDLGATKVTGTGFVEVDFHARRTLAGVAGSNVTGASLQVDMGGAYAEINERGAMKAPGDTLFSVPADGTLPGLTVSKFKLTRAAGNLDVTRVTIRTAPSNLNARLDPLPPFWTRLGELAADDTSPDFAAVLNAFLAEAQADDGFYAIPLIIHSDTLARLDVELAIEYVIEQTVLPPHLPEVTLPYGYSTLPGMEDSITMLVLPRHAIPVSGQGGAQIRGEFQPTRIALGPIGEEPVSHAMLVAPDCSLAQPLKSDAEIAVTGFDLPLANTQPGLAGLNMAIQADADGKPFGEVLASAEVRVEKPLPAQSTWGSATLTTPFRVLPGVRYWLVLQSRIGRAYWSTTSSIGAEPALQCSRDGGLSWRTAGAPASLAALFRLRHTPERFSVPVQLQIGKGPGAVRRRLDEFAPLGRVEFRFDFADALTEHLGSPALASPCGTGELLANGSFELPPHDDASRKLFGFDAQDLSSALAGTVDLRRGVNLSVQRFISLSLKGGAVTRIDCAGADPARTRIDEIVVAINRAMGSAVADKSIDTGTRAERLTLHDVMLHPWHPAGTPQGWQSEIDTKGQVWRVKLPILTGLAAGRSDRILAALRAAGTDPATLMQRVPVHEGCAYLLRFRFAIGDPAGIGLPGFENLDPEQFATPRREVRWFDRTGKMMEQDQAPLNSSLAENKRTFPPEEARLIAPHGATQAEIRFVQPPPGFLVLDEVSFTATLETLVNGGFRLWGLDSEGNRDTPRGWTPLSGWIDSAAAAVRLSGSGPEDAVLSQVVQVMAGKRYELRVLAQPAAAPARDIESRGTAERARLELRWLSNGVSNAPVMMALDGWDFPIHAWAGAAPTGATRAEIRLIQPQGAGELRVESVSFVQTDLVNVPLVFLAETPGELTASNLRIAYDLPDSTPLAQTTGSAIARPGIGSEHLMPAGLSAPAMAPLTSIKGIGAARARRLAEAGIDSLEKLAAAAPEELARLLRGISAEGASRLIEEAKQLLLTQG